MISKEDFKELVNRKLRILDVIKDELLSNSTRIELEEKVNMLDSDIEVVQATGGFVS